MSTVRKIIANPCPNGGMHKWDRSGHCKLCGGTMPHYYRFYKIYRHLYQQLRDRRPEVPVIDQPSDDPYVRGMESSSDVNPYRAGTENHQLWAAGKSDAEVSQAHWSINRLSTGVAAIFASLLLAPLMGARADILTFDIGVHPIDVALSAPLPAQWAYAADDGLVQSVDAVGITGGAYFPDGSDHGWTILPAVATVVAPAPAWSFELLALNPAVWRVDVTGDSNSAWNVIGNVVGGRDFLASLTASPRADYYGLAGVPVDADGAAFQVGDVAQISNGFPIFTPEPASLSIITGGAMLLTRRKS